MKLTSKWIRAAASEGACPLRRSSFSLHLGSGLAFVIGANTLRAVRRAVVRPLDKIPRDPFRHRVKVEPIGQSADRAWALLALLSAVTIVTVRFR